MHISINYCGTNSLTGAVSFQIYDVGIVPDKIIFDIDVVMSATDVNKELEKACNTFSSRNIDMSIGYIGKDLYKEEIIHNPNTQCYS